MIDIVLKPVETLVFRSPLLLLAEYHCDPGSPWFTNSGPSNAHAIVFPHTSTRIRAGAETFIENPTAVSFFNRGEEYSSELLSAEGSHCTWLALDSELLFELVDSLGGSRPSHDRVFRMRQTHLDTSLTLRQRLLFATARSIGDDDPLGIEEQAIAIAESAIASALDSAAPSLMPAANMIGRALELLAANFAQRFSLADLAREVGASPAYLSRAFRKVSGKTMHSFREELRLRRALDLLPQYGGDFTRLALDLGYSSHSHFSNRFRKLFHKSPRDLSTTLKKAS